MAVEPILMNTKNKAQCIKCIIVKMRNVGLRLLQWMIRSLENVEGHFVLLIMASKFNEK